MVLKARKVKNILLQQEVKTQGRNMQENIMNWDMRNGEINMDMV